MYKHLLIALLIVTTYQPALSQQTFDLVSYTAPKGWKVETAATYISYTKQDGGSWSQIGIYQHTPSKGSIQKDFDQEWNELVTKYYGIKTPAETSSGQADGWQVKTGAGLWKRQGVNVTTILTTYTGNGVTFSVLCNATAAPYLEDYKKMIGSLKPGKETPVAKAQASPAMKTSFAFNTTNFDDGWVSTVQEDWVEVTKGTIKVLLHYPKEGSIIPADPEPHVNHAWNLLAASRYNLEGQLKIAAPSSHYIRPHLAAGYATEKKSGKRVYVAFFKHLQPIWVEIISPDKNSFVREFGTDVDNMPYNIDSDVFNRLNRMPGYNKFSVAASDFSGTWTSSFTGMNQIYSVATGMYAGMYTNQSNEEFSFNGSNYNWKHLVVNTVAGRIGASQVASSGKFKVVNNWQLHFSKIESKDKLYNAHWSCIKGGRLLHLLDARYPGSGIYTIYGRK